MIVVVIVEVEVVVEVVEEVVVVVVVDVFAVDMIVSLICIYGVYAMYICVFLVRVSRDFFTRGKVCGIYVYIYVHIYIFHVEFDSSILFVARFFFAYNSRSDRSSDRSGVIRVECCPVTRSRERRYSPATMRNRAGGCRSMT